MSDLKEWVIQLRYPYTAGVIAVIWLGTAVLAVIRPEDSIETLIVLAAAATIIIALVGFSSSRR
ncbi:hypothetical protein IPP75_01545 [Candidatus Saccharibacteria bacterium]|jgi:hypothetical protein|nr:MAG: hypothetical protein IPP75_01545 [Candidatus Saccharibacteria bacterium]